MDRIPLPELARKIGAEPTALPDVEIAGVAGISEARPGDVTFLANRRYLPCLATCRASAVIVPRGRSIDAGGPPRIAVDNPITALINVVHLFYPERRETGLGVHPSAVVAGSAQLGADVSIHAHVVIEEDVQVGERTILMPGTFIGAGSRVGSDVLVYSNATVRDGVVIGDRVIVHAGAVIGSDGFGFESNGVTHEKIPQVGRVVIEDDVEIGANATVDRATLGATVIGKGTKIDNLVQIGHNVHTGQNNLICAQAGVSGSTELGDGVVLAGQCGVTGHIRVGDGAVVAGQAGVTRPVPDRACVSGYPARPHREASRTLAWLGRVPRLFNRLVALEERVSVLEEENRRLAGAALESV